MRIFNSSATFLALPKRHDEPIDTFETPKRKRVVIVSDSLDPWNFGGKEERWRQLKIGSTDDDDYQIIFATMKWWTNEPPECCVSICKNYPLYQNGKRSLKQAIFFSLSCFKVLKLKPDLIEVDQIPILPVYILKIVSKLLRVPLSITWHEFWNLELWRNYLGRIGYIAYLIEKWSINLADYIVAVSIPTFLK